MLLILPCEVAVKSVVPAIKALVAIQLVEKHGLRQDEVAQILGVSQSAVSKYTSKTRGYIVKIDDIQDVQPLIDKMVVLLLAGAYERQGFLAFFCNTCAAVRKRNAMCQFCQKADSKIEIEECHFCRSGDPRLSVR
jgi:predicted transcriptional regulator